MGLVEATLQAAKLVIPNPDFVLVTGDSMRHGGDRTPVPDNKRLDVLEEVLRNVTALLEAVRQ